MIIERTAEPETPEVDYWGVCPTCHKNNGYINIGKAHWFFCKEHKVRWCIGVNLFSLSDGETLETQEAAYNKLGMQNYEDVEPYKRTDAVRNIEVRTEVHTETTTYTLAYLTDVQMDTLAQALRCYSRCLTPEDNAGHSVTADADDLLGVFPEKFRARHDYIREVGGTLEMLLDVLIADIRRDVAIRAQGEVTEASYTETQADALQTAQRLRGLLK